MSETPGWLSPTSGAGAPAGDSNTFEMTSGVTPEPSPGASAAAGSNGNSSGEAATDDNDLPGVILTMRLANMGVAIALVACSVRFVDVRGGKCCVQHAMCNPHGTLFPMQCVCSFVYVCARPYQLSHLSSLL